MSCKCDEIGDYAKCFVHGNSSEWVLEQERRDKLMEKNKIKIEISAYEIVDGALDNPPRRLTVERTWTRRGDTGFHQNIPMDVSEMWAIRSDGMVLGKNGWEWEPRPSERSDEFINRTRFYSSQAAVNFLVAEIEKRERV